MIKITWKWVAESRRMQLRNLHKENLKLKKEIHAIKSRLIAAEEYIKRSPCDPDIYDDQFAAYEKWQSAVNGSDTGLPERKIDRPGVYSAYNKGWNDCLKTMKGERSGNDYKES